MTLSALGIFSAAGAGGGVALSDYELISTTTLGTATSSVTFSSLGDYSSTYKHLQLRIVSRHDNSGSANVFMRLNGDTGANYTAHRLSGNGSTVVSARAAETTNFFTALTNDSSEAANAFGAGIIDFLDVYAAKNKTVRTLTGKIGASFSEVTLRSGLYMSTASLTTILCSAQSGNFVTGSRFSLYGIKG
jgi:hypothetical protein